MEVAHLELTPVGCGISGMGVVPRMDPSALQTQQMAETKITHLLGPVPYSKTALIGIF